MEAISAQLGVKISMVIKDGEVIASPAIYEKKKAGDQVIQYKSELLENPAVKDIIDSFGGKIIDESIKKVRP